MYKKSLLRVVCSLKISCFPTETFKIKQSKNVKVLFFKGFQDKSFYRGKELWVHHDGSLCKNRGEGFF